VRRTALAGIGLFVALGLAGCPVPTGTDPTRSPTFRPNIGTAQSVEVGRTCPFHGQTGVTKQGQKMICGIAKGESTWTWIPAGSG
jgi:hypothetical protein